MARNRDKPFVQQRAEEAMDGIVSSESVGGQGVHSAADVERIEEERVNRAANTSIDKANHGTSDAAPRQVRRQPGNDFVLRLKGLPGPVKLQNADGSLLFESEGSEDVSTVLEVEGSNAHLSIKLTLSAMGFSSDFKYAAKDGVFITLEATDEGLKNSQVTHEQ
jgi:hypothetical protein